MWVGEVGGTLPRSLETRISGACVMIFPGGIMDGIGDWGPAEMFFLMVLRVYLIRDIRRNHGL